MKCKQELEYLAMIVQDFIASQPRSSQIAVAERAQACVNSIEQVLSTPDAIPVKDAGTGAPLETPEAK